jgi:hypothetical protein
MTRMAGVAFHALDLALIRGASWVVPFPMRAEWYREWRAELWHVRRSCLAEGVTWNAECQVAGFCRGALQDAACLRQEKGEVAVASASMHGSARQCLLCLCALLILCATIARLLPGIRTEDQASRMVLRDGVVLIEDGQSQAQAIPFSVYRDWASRRQRFFDGLAYYRTGRELAQGGTAFTVAHTSDALFRVLGVDIPGGGGDPEIPPALLSEGMWRRAFHSDPGVLGRTVRIGDQPVRIAGIAPAETLRLPGHADVWILETAEQLARTAPHRAGYVLALLSAAGQAAMDGQAIAISTFGTDDEDPELRGVTLGPQSGGPMAIYLFSLLLAVLALPAITSVFQSESSFASHQPSFRTRAKRAGFLAAKLALVAGVAYCAGLSLAYCSVTGYSPNAELLQFAASFVICLFGLRWAIMDQSRRCPVCLRRVTHPAQVGIASCNFLGWNGTEMICTGGHALLHVPSLPTSWFSRQRWMYLDTSWDFLFADPAHHS